VRVMPSPPRGGPVAAGSPADRAYSVIAERVVISSANDRRVQ
jgi:hypothetical protein